MVRCIVKGCKSSTIEPKRQTFPFPDAPKLREKWYRAIGRPEVTSKRNHRICLHHFAPDHVEKYHRIDGRLTNISLKKYRLHPDAVPSIFPGEPHPHPPDVCSTNSGNFNETCFNKVFLNATDLEVKIETDPNPIELVSNPEETEVFSFCQVCESTEDLIDISVPSNALYQEELGKIIKLENEEMNSFFKFICRKCGNKLEDLMAFRVQYEFTYRRLLERFVKKEIVESGDDPPVEEIGDMQDMEEILKTDITEDNSHPWSEDTEEIDDREDLPDTFGGVEEETLPGNEKIKDLADQEDLEKRNKKKKFFCEVCQINVKTKFVLLAHKMKHSGQTERCDICGLHISYGNVRRHIQVVHNGVRKFACNICGKSFSQSNNLKTHLRMHTDEINTTGQPSSTEDVPQFNCHTCGKSFTRLRFLKQHQIVHFTPEERIAYEHEMSQKRQEENAARGKGRKILICPTCGKTSKYVTQHQEHLRSHTGEKPFKCPHCDRHFRYYNQMKIHIRLHTGERPYKCNSCDAAFRVNAHLRLHVLTHTGEKPHKCLACGKAFRAKCNLVSHMRLHTGEKPYHCRLCPEKFTNVRVMWDHYKKTHFKDQDLRTPVEIKNKLAEMLDVDLT